jgi:hypothetical protein
MEWTEAATDLVGDLEEASALLPAASPPRPAFEKTWTSMGRTSMDDLMSHYLYKW